MPFFCVFMCNLQVALVDRAGRRTLTLVGLGGMCCCTVAMTLGMALQVGSQWMCWEAALKLNIIFYYMTGGVSVLNSSFLILCFSGCLLMDELRQYDSHIPICVILRDWARTDPMVLCG